MTLPAGAGRHHDRLFRMPATDDAASQQRILIELPNLKLSRKREQFGISGSTLSSIKTIDRHYASTYGTRHDINSNTHIKKLNYIWQLSLFNLLQRPRWIIIILAQKNVRVANAYFLQLPKTSLSTKIVGNRQGVAGNAGERPNKKTSAKDKKLLTHSTRSPKSPQVGRSVPGAIGKLPATEDYFYRGNRGHLMAYCRKCNTDVAREGRKKKSLRHPAHPPHRTRSKRSARMPQMREYLPSNP